MSKRIVALFLAALMAGTLLACGDTAVTTASTTSATVTTATTTTTTIKQETPVVPPASSTTTKQETPVVPPTSSTTTTKQETPVVPPASSTTTTKQETPVVPPTSSTTTTKQETPVVPSKPSVDVSGLAQKVISCFGNMPDPWEFLPESLSMEQQVLSQTPPAYTSRVTLSALPQNGIGKQLHTVHAALFRAQDTLGYVRTVYNGLTTVADLYQLFLNDSPDNYRLFEGTWSIFAIRIALSDTQYVLLAKASGVKIELRYDLGTQKVSGRAEVAGKAAVRYEMGEHTLKLAVHLAEIATTQMEFLRVGNQVTGYLYETVGVGDVRLSTSSLLTVTDLHTIAVGNKGDFAVPGQGVNVELYSNRTGKLVGTEVYETVKVTDYDTVWYPLYQIAGITDLRAVENTEQGVGDLSPYQIFLNGASDRLAIKYNTVFGVKTSRQYDVEFKTFYYYQYNEQKDRYEEVSVQIPMIFVQRENVNGFLADLSSRNGLPTLSNQTAQSEERILSAAYLTHKEAYLARKDSISYEDTLAFIGTADPWFE